jgi:hypothetical protein
MKRKGTTSGSVFRRMLDRSGNQTRSISYCAFALQHPLNLRTTRARLRCQSAVGRVAHSTVRPALWLSPRAR